MRQIILQTSTLRVKVLILFSGVLSSTLGYAFADSHLFSLFFFIVHVFTLGVSHGALDRWLYNIANPDRTINTHTFLIAYITVMSLVAILWFLIPSVALILFLIYSAWHFGEAEWKDILTNSHLNSALFTLWGLFLFAVLFFWNIQEVNYVIGLLDLNQTFILPSSELISWIVSAGWLLLSGFILVKGKVKSLATGVVQLSNVVVLILVFAATNLAISFALFFFYFHSILSFYHELKLVLKANPTTLLGFWIEVVVFSLLPCLGILIAALWGPKLISQELIFTLVVIGSAISFPHTILFSKALKST